MSHLLALSLLALTLAGAMHVLGAAGEADPYKDGIDKKLIPADRYSQITDGPVLLKRHDTSGEGLRDAA